MDRSLDVEIVPWNEEGRAMVWSWPGQDGACAACATAALRDGAAIAGRAVAAVCACARCGAQIAAVDDDPLDTGECDELDFGEHDPLDYGELDLAQTQESDVQFPEPPDVPYEQPAMRTWTLPERRGTP